MKKIEKLYCIVVSVNLALSIIVFDMYSNWQGVESPIYMILFFILGILITTGAVVSLYYPDSKKILLGSLCVNHFNLMFWSFLKESKSLPNSRMTVGFIIFVIILLAIGCFILWRNNLLNTFCGSSKHASFFSGNTAYQFNTVTPANQRYFQNPSFGSYGLSLDLYHGTPKVENARDILRYGFLIGLGNSHGTGLYMGDLETARGYARGTGSIIQVKLQAASHQIVDNNFVNSSEFRNWCSTYGNGNQGDNITNYALTVLKKRFLRVSQNFYVALANRTGENERVVFEGLKILGILDAQGNPI